MCVLIRFRICTIPLSFRRASVCVCLYGFASALSLAPHHVLASLVKGEVLSPEKFGRLPEGLPHHVLASLVKGSWIDGKAQALILLLSVCDTPTFFYLSNFSAVKTEGLQHHSLAPHRVLASPRKRGGGLTASHKPKYCSVFM